MNDQQLNSYRNRLRDMSARTRDDATAVREQALGPAGGQAEGALSNVPMHLADMGTETYLQELNATLLENEEYLLQEALAALRRIDAGSFGQCESCGTPIATDRLDALPYTRHCTECAQSLQPGPAVNLDVGRPASEVDFRRLEARDRRGARGSRSKSAQNSLADDSHAAGTPGGGTAIGGLAGTNVGRGDPDDSDLARATGSGDFDAREGTDDDEPLAGRSGGAVGGTPAGKRSGSGKAKTGGAAPRRPFRRKK